jgi:hypothetical protein
MEDDIIFFKIEDRHNKNQKWKTNKKFQKWKTTKKIKNRRRQKNSKKTMDLSISTSILKSNPPLLGLGTAQVMGFSLSLSLCRVTFLPE